MSSALII